jgi:hypothetical protein
MRTTINKRADLLRRAKRTAIERGSTLNEIVEMALAEFLERNEQPKSIPIVKLPRSKQSGGTQPGVNLDDGASHLDWRC